MLKKIRENKIKITLLILAIIVIGGLVMERKIDHRQKEPVQVFETMVVIRDQKRTDPTEDKKYSLKRGDVISVRSADHHWSKTEYASYLLVKIRGKKSELEQLLQPAKKETGKKDPAGKKIKEILLARAYKINLAKVGFSGDQVINGQPLKDKIFNWKEVVEKKAF